MFPCKQMEVNDKYREGWNKVEWEKDKKQSVCLCSDILGPKLINPACPIHGEIEVKGID